MCFVPLFKQFWLISQLVTQVASSLPLMSFFSVSGHQEEFEKAMRWYESTLKLQPEFAPAKDRLRTIQCYLLTKRDRRQPWTTQPSGSQEYLVLHIKSTQTDLLFKNKASEKRFLYLFGIESFHLKSTVDNLPNNLRVKGRTSCCLTGRKLKTQIFIGSLDLQKCKGG